MGFNGNFFLKVNYIYYHAFFSAINRLITLFFDFFPLSIEVEKPYGVIDFLSFCAKIIRKFFDLPDRSA